MFSIRTIIWLCLVILLLPTDEAGKQELHRKTSAVIGFASQVCANVEICAEFDPSWSNLAQKAQTGRDLVADIITRSSDAQYGATRTNAQRRNEWFKPAASSANGARSRNTLQIGDLIPEWHTPNRRTYASR